MWTASPRTALFEQNHAISRRIEEAAIVRDQSGSWSTMKEHDRLSVRCAALLVIKFVHVGDSDVPGVVRFDLVVESSQVVHGGGDYVFEWSYSANPPSFNRRNARIRSISDSRPRLNARSRGLESI